MKTTNKLLFVMWCCIALFTSCTPEPIPIYLDPVESKPVIWSQAIPNSSVLIYVSRTFSSLEFQENDTTQAEDLLQQFLAEDALVTVVHANETDTLFKISDGLFASLSMPLIPGDSYSLYVLDHTTGKSISSSTLMYDAVSIDSVSYTITDTSTVNATVTFTDPPGPNWYAVHFYSAYSNPLEVDDPFAAENIVQTRLLSDLELGSASASITQELEFLESDTFFVSLNNIGPEYFDYLQQRERGGSIYNQLIQEPINYTSNITNGYGMFSLHLPSVQMVIIEN